MQKNGELQGRYIIILYIIYFRNMHQHIFFCNIVYLWCISLVPHFSGMCQPFQDTNLNKRHILASNSKRINSNGWFWRNPLFPSGRGWGGLSHQFLTLNSQLQQPIAHCRIFGQISGRYRDDSQQMLRRCCADVRPTKTRAFRPHFCGCFLSSV